MDHGPVNKYSSWIINLSTRIVDHKPVNKNHGLWTCQQKSIMDHEPVNKNLSWILILSTRLEEKHQSTNVHKILFAKIRGQVIA
jgi:hypothetical protein